jgi:aryl-alcohol dehydrogenase-like predicted oxidoreductase
MRYRPLGTTGISVSELCLGTMQWRWTTSEAMSYRVMDAFLDAGANFIDTADIYSNWAKGLKGGDSEAIIGKWMAGRKNRRKVVLATKARGRMWEGPAGEGLSRAHLVQACEDSLRRLRTDYIDLYQSHWADEATPIEETLRAYDDLVRAGKVRYVGASNFGAGALTEAVLTARRLGLPQYQSYQPYYNLIGRDLEKEHVWVLKRYKIACIPYSPLAGGFLTGKYRKGKPLPKSQRAPGLKWALTDRNFALIDALERMGRTRGKTVLQMALAWLLAHDWMTAPIVGANTPAQLGESLGAVGVTLSPEEKTELDKLSA